MGLERLPGAIINDVAPREAPFAGPGGAVAARIALVGALHAAGLRRIEVGSLAPALAEGTIAVLAAARALPGLECAVLTSGRDALERALAVGAARVRLRLSVTEEHERASDGRGREAALAGLTALVRDAVAEGVRVRVDLDCVFDCPFEGVVPEADALDWVERVVATEPSVEIGLVDTTGNAAPDQVARVLRHALASWGTRFAFAGRDTYGMGAAGVAAAWREGCRVFDAASGGIGAAAAGAGHVATEDLAWMLRRMGVRTGLDLDALLVAADLAAGVPGAVPGGRLRGVAAARRAVA